MASPKKSRNVLLYAAPNSNADMLWFSRFHAGDPFLAFSSKGKKIGIVSLLEVTRAQKESDFDEVLNLQNILTTLRERQPDAGVAEVVAWAARKYKISSFSVPADFPASLYKQVNALGIHLDIGTVPFFPERVIKTKQEQEWIRAGNKASAAGFKAVEKILAESTIRKGFVWHEGKVLTSEKLHLAIERACLDNGALNVTGLIAAAGDQAVDCHCHGNGPIRANELIVVDIYPRVSATGYFGDMTRTYLKGKASPAQRKLVETVRAAQKVAFAAIKAGVLGADVHKKVASFFIEKGYNPGVDRGYQVGFFHGLGHGLGLDVHEDPSLGLRGTKPLKPGMVVTVEPGLYYLGIGGCRIEDVVLVTKNGCEPLSKHPYRWEFA
ncbi:MAG: Xaa-Pro peptidase family protein [Puniceicoccales bacterium]|jgi:Xaa-Pro aminopeptidase|nr:Xaa-Pro peptidase family protein [Puniceicoccales bacterium]